MKCAPFGTLCREGRLWLEAPERKRYGVSLRSTACEGSSLPRAVPLQTDELSGSARNSGGTARQFCSRPDVAGVIFFERTK